MRREEGVGKNGRGGCFVYCLRQKGEGLCVIPFEAQSRKSSRALGWGLTDDSEGGPLWISCLCPSNWTCHRGSEVSSLRILVVVSDYPGLRFWLDHLQIVAFRGLVLCLCSSSVIKVRWSASLTYKVVWGLTEIVSFSIWHWKSAQKAIPTCLLIWKNDRHDVMSITKTLCLICFVWFEIWVIVSFKCSLDWHTLSCQYSAVLTIKYCNILFGSTYIYIYIYTSVYVYIIDILHVYIIYKIWCVCVYSLSIFNSFKRTFRQIWLFSF